MNIDYDPEFAEWVVIYNSGKQEYLAPSHYTRTQALHVLDEIMEEMLVDEA